MAGGIFPGAPFRFNIKCVVFTLIVAGGYWFLPAKNIWMLGFFLWFPYLALAWYDWSYACQDRLEPTIVPFGRYVWLPFKPPGYQADYLKLSDSQIRTMDRVDHLIGWTILAAVLFFILLRAKML